MKLSQEELAEKIFVSRQTISNWENNKNYPDVKSLLLLSSLFSVSLDILIKGDLEEMKEKIKTEDIDGFKHDGNIFSMLMLLDYFIAYSTYTIHGICWVWDFVLDLYSYNILCYSS